MELRNTLKIKKPVSVEDSNVASSGQSAEEGTSGADAARLDPQERCPGKVNRNCRLSCSTFHPLVCREGAIQPKAERRGAWKAQPPPSRTTEPPSEWRSSPLRRSPHTGCPRAPRRAPPSVATRNPRSTSTRTASRWSRTHPAAHPRDRGETTAPFCHAAALAAFAESRIQYLCVSTQKNYTSYGRSLFSQYDIQRFLEVKMFHFSQDPEKDFFLHFFCPVFAFPRHDFFSY